MIKEINENESTRQKCFEFSESLFIMQFILHNAT